MIFKSNISIESKLTNTATKTVSFNKNSFDASNIPDKSININHEQIDTTLLLKSEMGYRKLSDELKKTIVIQNSNNQSTVSIFIANMVGAGFVSLPYASNLSGLIPNMIFLILGMQLSKYSCVLLIIVSCKISLLEQKDSIDELDALRKSLLDENRKYIDYDYIANKIYNSKIKIFIQIAYILLVLSIAISYINLVGTMLSNFIEQIIGYHAWYIDQKFIIQILTFLIVFPLTLIRNLQELKYLSFIQVIVILFCILSLIIYLFVDANFNNNFKHIKQFGKPNDIVLSFPLIVFNQCCQPWVLPIYEETKKKTLKNMTLIISISFYIVMSIQIITGFFGYIIFLENTNDSIFTNKGFSNNILIKVCNIMLILVVTTAQPYNIFPLRNFIINILFKNINTRTLSFLKLFILTFLINLIVSSIAISTTQVSDFLTLTGAIFTPLICYIVPCLFYIKLSCNRKGNILATVVVTFMSIISVYSIYSFINKKLN